MAKVESTNGKTTAPEKGKKGDGPLTITYLDDKGAEGKRVSENTSGIRVHDKSGKTIDFTISSLSPATRNALVALAVQKRVDTYVRNSVKADGGDVIELATSVLTGLKEGTIYSRKEGKAGGGAGRPFDTTFYRNIWAATAQKKKKDVTDKQLDALELKLKSMTPADRKTFIAKAKEDKVFAVCFKQAEAQKIAAQVKSGDAGEGDALSMF